MKAAKHGKNHPEKKPGLRFTILYLFVWLSFLIPIVYIGTRMITGTLVTDAEGLHSMSDYTLMLVECVLGLVAINAPAILGRRLKFEVPVGLYVLFIVFLYCAIFLGEVRSFYYRFAWWDTMLHCMSSMMTGFLGMMVITILNQDEHTVMHLSPAFVGIFAFCFSVTIGALWEIYEFTGDGLLGLNMQKFMLSDGTLLTGHAALTDTMKDIIVDCIGALLSTVIGVLTLRRDPSVIIPHLTKGNKEGK